MTVPVPRGGADTNSRKPKLALAFFGCRGCRRKWYRQFLAARGAAQHYSRKTEARVSLFGRCGMSADEAQTRLSARGAVHTNPLLWDAGG